MSAANRILALLALFLSPSEWYVVECETGEKVANQGGSCCCGELGVWWSGIDAPRQAFDDRIVCVYDPAACFCAAYGAVLLEEQVHGMLLAAASKFGTLAPGK